MMFRRATTADIPDIMEIITDAQQLLRSLSVDQWQDGYPDEQQIATDIANSEMYVAEASGAIVAMTVISFRGEPTYRIIEGRWLNESHYAVVHRAAVRKSAYGRNLGRAILNYAEELCRNRDIDNIRIDTHLDNKIMQHLLLSSGYTHCGTITISSGAKREAYQKEL